jgi:hypothetical protein
MNRLIIIGNGFDLAHDLKTRYSDFIDFLWKKEADCFYKSLDESNYESELIQVKLRNNDYGSYKLNSKIVRSEIDEFSSFNPSFIACGSGRCKCPEFDFTEIENDFITIKDDYGQIAKFNINLLLSEIVAIVEEYNEIREDTLQIELTTFFISKEENQNIKMKVSEVLLFLEELKKKNIKRITNV